MGQLISGSDDHVGPGGPLLLQRQFAERRSIRGLLKGSRYNGAISAASISPTTRRIRLDTPAGPLTESATTFAELLSHLPRFG